MLRTLAIGLTLLSLTLSASAQTAQISPASPFPAPPANARLLQSLGVSASHLSTPPAQACCKVCTVGKACGNTCISRDKTCHVGAGCACDG
jgi:hypothetical protein